MHDAYWPEANNTNADGSDNVAGGQLNRRVEFMILKNYEGI